MECDHDYEVCCYNTSIVIEECTKCGNEIEHSFDDFCHKYGFPVLPDELE